MPSLRRWLISKMVFLLSSIVLMKRLMSALIFSLVEMVPLSIVYILWAKLTINLYVESIPPYATTHTYLHTSISDQLHELMGILPVCFICPVGSQLLWRDFLSKLILQLFDSTFQDGQVVPRTRDLLMTTYEILQNEQMRMQMFHPSTNDQVAEDRENLIRVQHPFLSFESIRIVKSLYLFRDPVWTGHYRLELIDRRARLGHFVEVYHTIFIRLAMLHHDLVDLNVLDHIHRTPTLGTEFSHVAFHGEGVEAKLVFDCEAFRAAASEMVEYLFELLFLFFKFKGYKIEKAGVKSMISE